ncbi:glutathione S-transferase theta-1-like [Acanthaster planci]|uniref:Glutathione S-transferase theta-1-like n=1 Tax=Acanthaster planci TaxID=133434 RepID=A0A8B7ZMG7_ACAPL|nr:glutathione S-transferase theta-1-like [Acanthaster planci]
MSSLFRKRQVTPGAAGSSSQTNGRSMPEKPVTLYLIRLSPPCRIVWLYLAQNKIPYTLVDVDPGAEVDSAGRRPGLPSDVPHQDVPMLVDREIVVFEGPAILRYLSTRYTDHAGYGQTIAQQMLVESVINWAHADLHRIVGYRCTYPQVFEEFQLEGEAANEVLIETGIKRLSHYLERLEKRYLAPGTGKYLCGDALTLADSTVATVLLQAEWMGFSLRLWPRVAEWLQAVCRQDYWEEVHGAHEAFVSQLRAGILYPASEMAGKNLAKT